MGPLAGRSTFDITGIAVERGIGMRTLTLLSVTLIGMVCGANGVSAREIHVSKVGSDSASGSEAQPGLTIDQAASVAQPGDTVIVHAGTYREWAKPVRGGSGEGERITYR